MRTTAIIVAAGRGTRAGGALPKQWQDLRGAPVIAHTIRAFAGHVDDIVLVLHGDDLHRAATLGLRAVAGGDTRDASVQAGLAALAADPPDYVLIHDAARPLVSADLIARVKGALATHTGAAPALPVTDALWTGTDDLVTGTQDRAGLYRAQTPQGFHYGAILAAHAAFAGQAADDVAVARAAGLDVAIVAGDADNLKITQPDDFARAAKLMGRDMDIRTGNGFDVHRFGDGDHVMLCGVAIPHSRGLQGHSDADVGLHTITDAIYGALARGDIGQHFPPSDPQWKACESHVFLRHAVELAANMGFTITHIDCTLICEFPKIGPHADAMRARVADITGLDPDRISVKATTSERLGFTGRGEGIAAMATATLVKS
ncbi:bifunctional 2-C-methyl-D-erythritol 4-phosphate cytidylyltransferase/2-C-methyl-D-erythritol 2,4-cyclodiphosphate synthase [Octadecabacter sp. R77987]|uniref:bifunctional 2-C-methyl-D-erythritol 4-phosphate cytidylyltransferase/2-C-methyl-D-erythritol 2,4-cyclodiphosphate synthase n=1 Tax=Octadecabacter sp. R77987 TaxID=3093874 RepID=UPI00366D9A19